MFKRRNFLTTCTVGTAVLATPLGLAAGEAAKARPAKDIMPTPKKSFQSLLHNNFRCMSNSSGAKKIKLVEFIEGPRAPGLDQFTLVFEEVDQTDHTKIQDGLYTLFHPETGPSLVQLVASDTVVGRYTSHFGLFT